MHAHCIYPKKKQGQEYFDTLVLTTLKSQMKNCLHIMFLVQVGYEKMLS